MENLIEFKDLCVKYENNEHLTIKNMNIGIKDGEFIVFVGPSGCGKSTTLKVLSGLEEIHSGEIHIAGEVANYKEPKERNIAMVFQNYALYPHYTVRKNIEVGLKAAKLPKNEVAQKVEELATKLNIDMVLDSLPKDLSGGQQQRVALARAIIREPLIYIFDEPLSNLDAKLRHSTRNQIMELHRELKRTFFYVTHDQVEAMTMADRIVVLKDGIVQQYDRPINIFYKPANLFVAKFMGTPEINTFVAKVNGDTLMINEKFVVNINDAFKEILSTHETVHFGIRPDDIEYSCTPKEGFLPVSVTAREILGNSTIINGLIGDAEINFVINTSDYIESVEYYYIKIDSIKGLYFDIDTELNLNV